MTSNAPPLIPNPFRIRPTYADDIASEVVALLAVSCAAARLSCYLDAAGVFAYSFAGDCPGFHEFDLIGVYTKETRAGEIAADIAAMQRECLTERRK